jgi:hypothetical protein
MRLDVQYIGPGRYTACVWLLGRMGYELIYCVPAETRISAIKHARGFVDRLRTALREFDDDESI